ncbi:TP901 family phage tail tape measure protein [Pedobacter sp. UYP24]
MASTPRSIRASLYIDGQPAENSIKNVSQVARALRRDLEGMVIGSTQYNNTLAQLRVHEQTLQRHRDGVRGVAGAFGWLRTEVGKMGALAVGFLGLQFITEQFQNIIVNNAKLSDSLADVRKTTGLSEEGVRRLHTELGKLETRTSRKELLDLAQVAGKLGVSGERDVLGFVRAADKIKVALGGDLGDAEAAVNSLGKLTELFKIKEEFGLEGALIKTGSAINALGAAGTASEAYLVEFTKRMGGIAPQANFSIQSILGLAATMDELGQPVEASTTAIGQFVIGMGKDIPGFAKIAGMSVKQFSTVLKTDGNQALLEVLKNLQSTGMGVAGLAEKMGMIGEEGARATSALGALSNNLDLLVSRQKLSNEQFELGTSLQQEFDIKMSTFGATLDNMSKKFNALSTNSVLTDFLKNMVFGFSQFLDWGQRNAVMIVNFTKFLIVAGVAWIGYRSAILLTNTALEINAARTALTRTVSLAFAYAQALLTGNTLRATAALRALNVTAAANPFGAVLAVVLALVTAFALYSKTTTAAQKAQQAFNSIDADAKKNQLSEIDRILQLKKVLDNESIARDKKLLAIKRLKEIMPDALKQLSDEEMLTNKGSIAIGKYIQQLEKKSIAEAAQAEIQKLRQRNIEIDSGAVNDTTIWQDTKAFLRAGTIDKYKENQKGYGKANAGEERAGNVLQIKSIQDKYKNELNDVDTILKIGDVTTGTGSTGGLSSDKKDKAKQEKQKALIEFEKLDDKYKKLNLQRLDDQLSANEKEVAQEANKYNSLIKQEQEFLKFKGITAEQKKITEAAIKTLETDRDTSTTNLRVRQETEMLQKISELRTNLADIHESELVKQQNQINKFYDQQEKQNEGNEKALAILRRDRIRELNDSELREKQRLEKEKLDIESKYETLSGNKKENKLALINKKYDDEIIALKEKFSKELQATQEFQDAVKLIGNNRAAETKFQELSDLQQKRDFQIQLAQQAADATFNIISNNQKAQLEHRITGIEKERDAELSQKNLTEKQKTLINDRYNQKVKEEKLKGWKAEQSAAVAQAVVNGALAVTKVLAQTGILSPFAIPAIVAGTAFQIGTILAQPTPQFGGGGFSNEDPAGFVNSSTVFANSASGRPFEAGEKGREWIAPNWMIRNPRYANIINTLEVARKEKRSFASGGFNDTAKTSVSAPATNAVSFDKVEKMLEELIRSQRIADSRPVVLSFQELRRFGEEVDRVEIAQGR